MGLVDHRGRVDLVRRFLLYFLENLEVLQRLMVLVVLWLPLVLLALVSIGKVLPDNWALYLGQLEKVLIVDNIKKDQGQLLVALEGLAHRECLVFLVFQSLLDVLVHHDHLGHL